jgi:phosphoribosylanthranilate isomerase
VIRIKICGLTGIKPALEAGQAGADFLGLVFAPSRRQVTPEKGQAIVRAVRGLAPRPAVVGVFVNRSVGDVNRITDDCQLDWVQLSGRESWSYCQKIKKPIVKVIHISPGTTVEEVLSNIETGYHRLAKKEFFCLLDAKVGGAYGGTGQTFDWELARAVSARFPVMVAGGLTPTNVGQLIMVVKPWGVDVSSGVETNGRKDISKIKAFIEAVRSVQ